MNAAEKAEHDKRIALMRLIDQKLNGYASGLEARITYLERQLGEASTTQRDLAERLARLEDRSRADWD